MMPIQQIQETLRQMTGSDTVVDEKCTPVALLVPAKDIVPVCNALFRAPSLYFDMLSCITGLDNGPGKALEVIYNLYSIPFNISLMLKVALERDSPVVDSVSAIWKSANWLEREVYDMFGVTFNHHPDLRRILMPADWTGHPLRRDEKPVEAYHGLKTEN